MKKLALFFVLFSSLIHYSSVQVQRTNKNLDELYIASGMTKIAESIHDNGWIEFKKELMIDPNRVFIDYKNLFGLNKDDEMILIKVTEDTTGREHYRYQQVHSGIKVEGMVYNIHALKKVVYSANGKIAPNLQLNTKAKFSHSDVKSIARNNVRISSLKGKFINQNINEDSILIIQDTQSKSDLNYNYKLAYRFIFHDTIDNNSYRIYVDPIVGDVIKIKNSARDAANPSYLGSCNTKYHGNESVYTYYYNAGLFCPDYYYIGPAMANGLSYIVSTGSTEFPCNQPTPGAYWSSQNRFFDPAVLIDVSAFWGVQKANLFFANLGTYKMTNETMLINTAVSYSSPNASYNPDISVFNFGAPVANKCSDMVELDIIGHEYAHGVIHWHLGDLSYSGETGAIEEGLCDVFGAMIETSSEGYDPTLTYTMGYYSIISDLYKRSLSNPNSLGAHSTDPNCQILEIGQPSSYQGTYWDYRGCDESGIHTNSSVMSHWFYLLAEGGAGVSGIGRTKATQIIYQFIRKGYLDYGSSFSDARIGTTKTVCELYGLCSNEYNQVLNAWNAVNVYNSYVGAEYSRINESPSLVCQSGYTFSINCLPCSGNIIWNKSNNLSFVGGNTGQSITVTAVSSGMASVSAILYTACGNFEIPGKSFWAGVPQLDYVSGPSYGQTYNSYYFNAYPSYDYRSQASYNWVVSPWADLYPDYSGASVYFYDPYGYQIAVYASNSCGTSNTVYSWIDVTGGGNYILSPNPANNEIIIRIKEPDSDSRMIENNPIYTISIFNVYGLILSKGEYSGDLIRIPVNKLQDGNYFIRIDNGKSTQTKQLIIKH